MMTTCFLFLLVILSFGGGGADRQAMRIASIVRFDGCWMSVRTA